MDYHVAAIGAFQKHFADAAGISTCRDQPQSGRRGSKSRTMWAGDADRHGVTSEQYWANRIWGEREPRKTDDQVFYATNAGALPLDRSVSSPTLFKSRGRGQPMGKDLDARDATAMHSDRAGLMSWRQVDEEKTMGGAYRRKQGIQAVNASTPHLLAPSYMQPEEDARLQGLRAQTQTKLYTSQVGAVVFSTPEETPTDSERHALTAAPRRQHTSIGLSSFGECESPSETAVKPKRTVDSTCFSGAAGALSGACPKGRSPDASFVGKESARPF